MNKAHSNKGVLYLLPSPLHSQGLGQLVKDQLECMRQLRHFAVENERPARRFLRAVFPDFPIDDCRFVQANKRSEKSIASTVLKWLESGHDVGMISDAGCPGVADPGSELVGRVHEAGFKVHPFAGPSSFVLALMGSGFSGQMFRMVGYLPIAASTRKKIIQELEFRALSTGETQIFMETPYRNLQLLEALFKALKGSTRLCIAADLTGPEQFIGTCRVQEWKMKDLPTLHKVPVVFLIGK